MWSVALRQVGSKTDCVMCFGPTVPDGYGVCYNPMEEHINMAITAFNSCEETNAARFAQAVEGALLDMRALLEDAEAMAQQWSCTLANDRKWPKLFAERMDVEASLLETWEEESGNEKLPLWWDQYSKRIVSLSI